MSASNSDPKLDSRKCILSAAAKLFSKLGLDKCSTREIAKESDANISLISYYFGGKEGLYKEVMREHALEIKDRAQKILERSKTSPPSKESFINEMSEIIETIIWLRVQNPEMAKIFAREKLAGMPYSKDLHKEIFYPMTLNIYHIFKQAQDNGFVKKDINPALFFVTLSEGVWGFFEIIDCDTDLNKDCEKLVNDINELKNQIIKIYLTGVLV